MPSAPDISIIVPARNEARLLGPTLDAARQPGVREVIVVDGASRDATISVARSRGARVVSSAAGRGRQLNAGAAVARGDILLFVHADTRLPHGVAQLVRATLAPRNVAAGVFGLAIDDPHPLLRVVETLVGLRSRVAGLPFGDQALFLGSTTFRRAGGFPDWPVLEDAAFVRSLAGQGRIATARGSVTTSARRWRTSGIVRTTIVNQLSYWSWRLGADPVTIAARRETWSRGPAARPRPAASRATPVAPTPAGDGIA